MTTQPKQISLMPGDTLPNGAIVLKMRGETVLALWRGSWQPWVTWQLDDDHNAYLGHYFATLARALEDFDKRHPRSTSA